MLNFSSALRPDYLFVDKYNFTSNWVFPQNRVPYSMLRYIISGSAKFTIDNDDVVVEAGQIIYIPDGSMLCCEALDDGVSFISIRFISTISSGMVDVWTDQYGAIPVIPCQDEFIKARKLSLVTCARWSN